MHASALRIVGLFLLLVSAWKSCEYLASGADQHGLGAAAVRDWGDWLFAGVAAVGLYGLTLRETRQGVRQDTRHEAPPPQTAAQLLRAPRLEGIGILTGGIAHDLNNVVTPILMAVKLLNKESGLLSKYLGPQYKVRVLPFVLCRHGKMSSFLPAAGPWESFRTANRGAWE